MEREAQSDEVLVAATRSGDAEAFSHLVHRYHGLAFGVAFGVLTDFELARDIVQDAFVCAYTSLPKLRAPGCFGPWLRSIVRRTSFGALRERDRLRTIAQELALSADVFDSNPAPEDGGEVPDERMRVREALTRLNDAQREAVSLHYLNGLSYDQIASLLAVSASTIQGRLQRARAKLRKELAMIENTFDEERTVPDAAAEAARLIEATVYPGQVREQAVDRLPSIGSPAVAPLCAALGDPRQALRVAAARALCRIGDRRALRPVLRLLNSFDLYQFSKTGRLLGIPGMRDELLAMARTATGDVLAQVVYTLARAGDDPDVYGELRRIYEERPEARHPLLDGLCRLQAEATQPLLDEALCHGPPVLRADAVAIAWRNGCVPPLAACVTALCGKFPENVWVRDLIGPLTLRHGASGRAALEEIARTGAPAARVTAAVGLATVGAPEAFPILIAEISGGAGNAKWLDRVSHTLAEHCATELVQWLDSHLEAAANPHIVAWTLARCGCAVPDSIVRHWYMEGPPAVRAAALQVLVRRRGQAAIPELRRCLRAGSPRKLAAVAFRAMARIGPLAEAEVTDMLQSDAWTERKAAIALLRRWRKLTPRHRAAAAQDAHPAVRDAAAAGRR